MGAPVELVLEAASPRRRERTTRASCIARERSQELPRLWDSDTNQQQLLSILQHSPGGNGLVSLAQQLIAAKLNLANGTDASCVAATVADADTLIGYLIVPSVGTV